MTIRYANENDLPRIIEIRNHYILNSFALFETTPATLESLQSWFQSFKDIGPYRIWVCEENNVLKGFAYSSPYRNGEYFAKTIETSIYVDPKLKSKGTGTALYSQLFTSLKSEMLHTAVVGIAMPNAASVALHKKFGFVEVGIFKEYAVKNGHYISSLWMQKMLG